jgi:hypothetical protein
VKLVIIVVSPKPARPTTPGLPVGVSGLDIRNLLGVNG